jgi:hypothetical protein
MPEQTEPLHGVLDTSDVTARVHSVAVGLTALLEEADAARRDRAEVAGATASEPGSTSAVCAWNHFENIPTFYNWNNRPR